MMKLLCPSELLKHFYSTVKEIIFQIQNYTSSVRRWKLFQTISPLSPEPVIKLKFWQHKACEHYCNQLPDLFLSHQQWFSVGVKNIRASLLKPDQVFQHSLNVTL